MATSNLSRIGHVYPPAEPFTMTTEAASAYAAATDDKNTRYPAVAPPMSAVIYGLKPAAMPVMDEALVVDTSRILKLLHGEQEIRWLKPVKPGDVLFTSATVQSITDKGTGELIEIATRSLDKSAESVVEMVWGFFIRHSKKDIKPLAAKPAEPDKKPDRAPDFELSWTVAKDQPARYAAASGDHNPIHTDDAIAKMAGLNGVILHGLCTMAFAQRAIIDRALSGDPGRLSRMKVRFTKPVYPGQTLTARLWVAQEKSLSFEVVNESGDPVLKDGVADLR
jgi:acyl dehydratase